MTPDELIGLTELVQLLGVSRATAARRAGEPGFPAPVETLARGRVWRRRDVEKWLKANPPRPPGRPPKQSG